MGDEVEEPVIVPHGDPVGGESVAQGRGEGLRLDEEGAADGREGEVGQEDGGAGDVVPAQVEQPSDVRQAREQMDGAPGVLHVGAEPGELVAAAPAGPPRIHGPDGPGGAGRPVGPDLADEVEPVLDARAAPPREGGVAGAGPGVHAAAVEAEGLAVLETVAEEVLDGGHPRLALLHQADAGACELVAGLEEVPPVGPQSGPLGEDEEGPGGPGEAGDPGAAGEVVADGFAAVWVGGGDEVGVDAARGHGGAEGLELRTHGEDSFLRTMIRSKS